MDVERLRVLETKIELVLAEHEALCRERDRLREQLGQANKQIGSIDGQLREHEKERAEMKAHVERILSRLDGLNLG